VVKKKGGNENEAVTPMAGDVILTHFGQPRGRGHAVYMRNVAYRLMQMILDQLTLDSAGNLPS